VSHPYQLEDPVNRIHDVVLTVMSVIRLIDTTMLLGKVSVGLSSKNSVAGLGIPLRTLFLIESAKNGARCDSRGPGQANVSIYDFMRQFNNARLKTNEFSGRMSVISQFVLTQNSSRRCCRYLFNELEAANPPMRITF